MARKPGRAGLTILPDKRQASSRLFPLAASTAETKPSASPVIFRGSAVTGGAVSSGLGACSPAVVATSDRSRFPA